MKLRGRLLCVISIILPACHRPISFDQSRSPFFEAGTGPEGFLPRTAKPDSLGLSSDGLMRLIAEAQAGHSHALILVKDGRVVVERYFGHPQEPMRINSGTKAIVSLAIGMLIRDGKISSVYAPLSTWFPEFRNGDKARITLWNVLTHTTGLSHEKTAETLYRQQDVVHYAASLPVIKEPGKDRSYSNEAVALLAGIVSSAAGKPLDAYLQEKLFGPMNISSYDWDKDPAGNPMAYGGLWMLPRDLARIGQLVLNNGRWEGKQLVPAAWIKMMTSPARNDIEHFGLLWGLYGYEAGPAKFVVTGFNSNGYQGQYLIVYPQERLVAVRMHARESDGEGEEYSFYPFEEQVGKLLSAAPQK
jgi:CubicO group peptidase (beta-lactamase class C family)